MKTKLMYLSIVATMLLAACSGGAAANASTSKTVATPVTSTVKVQPQNQPAQAPATKSDTAAQGQTGGGGTPPAEAIAACTGKTEQATCEFTWQKGTESGVCETVQTQLACSPQHGPANGDLHLAE